MPLAARDCQVSRKLDQDSPIPDRTDLPGIVSFLLLLLFFRLEIVCRMVSSLPPRYNMTPKYTVLSSHIACLHFF